MKISGIYQIKSNIKPERVYIGSAVNIQNRWALHLFLLRKKQHHSLKLQRHYNKYGESDLSFTILLGCRKEDLLKVEQYFIDSYNPYFNICRQAGSQFGIKRSEKTKKKLRISHLGHSYNKGKKKPKQSPEHIEKRISKVRGIKRSDEFCNKMSNILIGNQHAKGCVRSKETRKRMSDAQKLRFKKSV